MRRAALLLAALLVVVPSAAAQIRAPDGVQVERYADDIPRPANLAFDDDGGLWVVSSGYGAENSDGVWYIARRGAQPVHVVRELLYALGVAWYRDELYVAHAVPYRLDGGHTGQVVAYSGFDGRRFANRRVVLDGLPVGRHNADSIVPGPDGRLSLGVGSQTDSDPASSRRSAAVISFNRRGRRVRVEGRGLRNPYGLAFIPGTSTLLVSDNGRDDLGLGRPPDELNAILTKGRARFFGFPRCWGQGGRACRRSKPALVRLPEHAAAAGVAVSPDWRGDGPTAFVAQNGSSFDRNPTGHDVVAVELSGKGKNLRGRRRSFATGFREHDPVGAAIGPDGALYVTLIASGEIVRFVPPPPSAQRVAAAIRPAGATVGLAIAVRRRVGDG